MLMQASRCAVLRLREDLPLPRTKGLKDQSCLALSPGSTWIVMRAFRVFPRTDRAIRAQASWAVKTVILPGGTR